VAIQCRAKAGTRTKNDHDAQLDEEQQNQSAEFFLIDFEELRRAHDAAVFQSRVVAAKYNKANTSPIINTAKKKLRHNELIL
jgi:hypothetical protein